MIEIKPCPFCGQNAEILNGACYPIGCRQPNCHGWIYRDAGWSNKAATIKAWNIRHGDNPPEEEEAK